MISFLKNLIKLVLKLAAIVIIVVVVFAVTYRIRYKVVVNAKQRPIAEAASPAYSIISDVDPFIGTGSFYLTCAYNYPGPSLPFGVVRLSPETASLTNFKKGKSTSGYFYGDDKICGFSHTRLGGTGATDGGHFLVSPSNGNISKETYSFGKFSRYSHRDETAFPGYYAVKLPDENVFVELTATNRVGIHRYTFSDVSEPHVLINLSNTIGNRRSEEGAVRILPENNEIVGSTHTYGSFAGRFGGIKVYFVARFNQQFKNTVIWQGKESWSELDTLSGKNIGVDLGFSSSSKKTVITLDLAISHISIENARANLEAEVGTRSFEEVFTLAQKSWVDKLSVIDIQGATDDQRSIFYTALYRVFQMPTIFTDVNSEYMGFDKNVHRADSFNYFTDLSLWDTFRTVHPLYNIIAPADQLDMMISLVQMAKEGGWLPAWPSGYGYTGSMLGTPADISISDAWLKGIQDFDIEYAYQAMLKTAMDPTPDNAAFRGRRGIESYLKYQYCAADEMDESVSKTLEYAWADYAIGQLATSLGKEEDAAIFSKRAQYYRNTWNPETQYFHPRNSDGSFVADFKPTLLTYLDRKEKYTNDYTEGSALQWRWAVPFDPQGLISIFGGDEHFVDELNSFFEESDPTMAAINPKAYYWHGNEPDIHAAYLFNEAGRPDLTQKWVRWILENKYSTSYEGLDGNDDAGTLSAWYVFSSLGFYPIAGTDIYQLGAPLFEKANVSMNDRTLLIETTNYSQSNMYVRKVWLNGTLLNRNWIRHYEIAEGGVLKFEMSPIPDK